MAPLWVISEDSHRNGPLSWNGLFRGTPMTMETPMTGSQVKLHIYIYTKITLDIYIYTVYTVIFTVNDDSCDDFGRIVASRHCRVGFCSAIHLLGLQDWSRIGVTMTGLNLSMVVMTSDPFGYI